MRVLSTLFLLAIPALAIPAAEDAPLGPDVATLDTTSLEQQSTSAGWCRSIEVRREWRTFSKSEKKAYLDAVKCLAKRPHSKLLKPTHSRSNLPNVTTQSSFYDDMTYIHMDLTDQIHYTGLFLPWHRWYTNQHVTELKSQCGYKGVMPYWDWSKDAAAFDKAPVFDSDPNTGFGTFGNPNNDYYLNNGALTSMQVAYPIKRQIRRQYVPFPYLSWYWVPRPTEEANTTITYEYVNQAINNYVGDFVGFQNATEKAQAFHANIHMMLGGDMAGTCPTAAGESCIGGSTWTPNDPLFFLHHANVDRIWYLWQLRNPKNFYAFKGGSISNYSDTSAPNGYPPMLNTNDLLPTDGLFPQKTIASQFNFLGGDLCYVYK